MNVKDHQQITIQIGSYSNYVGAHFWNFQDDIIRDLVPRSQYEKQHEQDVEEQDELPILYNLERMYQIRNIRGNHLSITPRALIIEHRGSLGAYNPTGEFEEQIDPRAWNGEKSVIKKAQEEKNAFIRMLEQEENYYWSEDQTQNEDEEKEDIEDPEIEEIRVDESMVKSWTDYLKVRFHSSSICELPFWPISQPFDTFSSGTSQDIISVDRREEYFDRIRRLIEDCDWLRNVTIIADLFDGFGGLTCSLCEEIRDEIPRITMPIWAFTDDSSSVSDVSKLQQCNIPLSYSALLSSDIASVLIPMSTYSARYASPFVDLQSNVKYHTSSIFASALEVGTGFQRLASSSSAHSTSDALGINTPESRVAVENVSDGNWAAELTSNYQYRLCTLEASLPYPINPAHDNCFAPLWEVFSRSSRHDVINPFMYSLSAATWGFYSGKHENRNIIRSRLPISNIINCRGFQSSIFTSQLTSYTHNYSSPLSNYYVSGIHQRSYGLPIPNSFPAIFRGVDSEGFLQLSNSRSPTHYASVLFPSRNKLLEIDSIRETERQNGVLPHHCDSLVAMTGLGCDRSLLSPHLKTILSIWRERGNITTSELSRLGISQGDCHEIDENLANLVARYSDEE